MKPPRSATVGTQQQTCVDCCDMSSWMCKTAVLVLLASGMFLVHGIYTCLACRLGCLVSHIQLHTRSCEAQTTSSPNVQRFRISTCGRVKTDKCSFLLTSVYSAEAMVASGVLPWQLINSISRASLHAKGRVPREHPNTRVVKRNDLQREVLALMQKF